MNPNIPAYILFSSHEPERQIQVNEIIKHLPQVEIIEPVFPKYQRVPFLHSLVQKSKERTGKKLGFIAQEIGREINTLGSKSNHAQKQKIVVDMKDSLEKIKEQVLNTL